MQYIELKLTSSIFKYHAVTAVNTMYLHILYCKEYSSYKLIHYKS